MARQRGALLDAGVLALAVVDAWLRAATEGSGLVVSLVAALALILRRRGPLLAFVFTLPALFAIGLLVAPFVALYTVAERSRPRGAVLSCAVVAGVGDFLPWPPTHFHLDEVLSHGLDLIDSVVYVGASVALGVLVRTRRELSARLAELTAARERQRQLESRSLLARERARLAREMHDVVSHQVSLIAVQAGALRVTARDVTVRETADVIRRLSVGTLEELRDMVRVLRAAGGQGTELAPQPRLRDIHDLVEKAGQNARVVIDAVDGGRWPDPVERAAYRTVQEALTNVNKHAPDAAVTVQVRPWGAGLCVAVRNGPPPALPPAIDLPGGGHGLMGLRERAELLGGAVRAGPTQDGGFVVEALFPNDSRTERDPDR